MDFRMSLQESLLPLSSPPPHKPGMSDNEYEEDAVEEKK